MGGGAVQKIAFSLLELIPDIPTKLAYHNDQSFLDALIDLRIEPKSMQLRQRQVRNVK